MPGLGKLKDLKKAEGAPAAVESAEKVKPAKAAKTETTEGKEKKAFAPPRTKSPEKQALEDSVKKGITDLLKGDKTGKTAEELRNAIFDKVDDGEIKSTERLIRQLCRSMGCKANPIEGSRRVRYTLQ